MKRLTCVIMGFALLSGCAGYAKTTRVADPTKGDYYTTEEIKGLSKADRDRYCSQLEGSIQSLRNEAAVFDTRADSIRAASDSLRAESSRLTAQIRDLDNEIRQLRLARRAASTYIVKAGDTFQTISSAVYGSPERAKEIFEANKGIVPDMNRALTPGLRLTIPAK